MEFKVLDKETGEPLTGATISFGNGIGNITNTKGLAQIEGIPEE